MSDKGKKNRKYKNSREENLSFQYIQKKTERIVAAVYLLTDTIPNDDPLKGQLRSFGLTLLETVVEPEAKDITGKYLRSVVREYQRIISLITVAAHAQYLSEMNYSILVQELNDQVQFVARVLAHQHRDIRQAVLSDDFFDVSKNVPRTNDTLDIIHPKKEVFYKGQDIKRHNNVFYNSSQPLQQENVSEQFLVKTEKERSIQNKKHGDRRSQIISIIEEKDKVSIKDISSVVTNCSEKTLQRELLAMVNDGVLKKEGERRWSTYSMAQP